MNITILIDRIVLENKNFSPSQLGRLQAEIETELTNLLTVNGIPRSLQFGKKTSNLSISLSNISSITNPAKLGQNIALSIYSEMSTLMTIS